RVLRTLGVRRQRNCRNAAAVASFLSSHEKVNQVYYPGLPSHDGHAVATTQMSDFGGLVSFTGAAPDAAARVGRSTRLFVLAESLGAVESLIELPGPMTHASVSG